MAFLTSNKNLENAVDIAQEPTRVWPWDAELPVPALNGMTPLHCAAAYGLAFTVKELIAQGL